MERPEPSETLILASASPRRRALLDLLGLVFEVRPADVDETPHPGEDPSHYARRLAFEKARAVADSHRRPVLAADTVVAVDGEILGKPSDEEDAQSMLRRLSGRSHLVHTGVALTTDGRSESLVDTATVVFRSLTDAEIRWYVATGEPADKAGAYAVQGAGGLLVEAVEGSPQTVIGLPVHRLPALFARCGLDFLSLASVTEASGRPDIG